MYNNVKKTLKCEKVNAVHENYAGPITLDPSPHHMDGDFKSHPQCGQREKLALFTRALRQSQVIIDVMADHDFNGTPHNVPTLALCNQKFHPTG